MAQNWWPQGKRKQRTSVEKENQSCRVTEARQHPGKIETREKTKENTPSWRESKISNRANSWYEQKPEGVVESENVKILWDVTVQCDRKIEARRPDFVFADKKEREVVKIDVAIPGDDRVKDKELEKVEKYQLLKDKIAKVRQMRKVIVVPVVIGALGAVSVNFKEYMRRIGVKVRLEVIQKTALLGTAKILRKVLSL